MYQFNKVGVLPTKAAERDADGELLSPAEYGNSFYHVNAIGEVPESWLQYELMGADKPETPYRVYAGDVETRFFRFPDKQAFENHLDSLES